MGLISSQNVPCLQLESFSSFINYDHIRSEMVAEGSLSCIREGGHHCISMLQNMLAETGGLRLKHFYVESIKILSTEVSPEKLTEEGKDFRVRISMA
jgi:hypothetical protein